MTPEALSIIILLAAVASIAGGVKLIKMADESDAGIVPYALFIVGAMCCLTGLGFLYNLHDFLVDSIKTLKP